MIDLVRARAVLNVSFALRARAADGSMFAPAMVEILRPRPTYPVSTLHEAQNTQKASCIVPPSPITMAGLAISDFLEWNQNDLARFQTMY